MKHIIIIPMITLIVSSYSLASSEKLIPRSTAERCKYYFLKSESVNGLLKITHKQVCSKNEFYSGVGYSLTLINCKKRLYKSLGYGDDSLSNINLYKKSNWTRLVQGSSKSDLINFVCE